MRAIGSVGYFIRRNNQRAHVLWSRRDAQPTVKAEHSSDRESL